MASIKDNNGFKEIRFFDRNRKRRSLYAGKINMRQAEAVAGRIEAIVSLQIQGLSLDPELSRWLVKQEDNFHAKLAKLGLCQPRERKADLPTLKAWTDRYIAGHTGKPGTIEQLQLVANDLCDFLGADQRIDTITAGDAEDYRRSLEKRKLALATIRKRISRSKQFFKAAIKHKLIKDNPFAEEESAPVANPARMFHVPADWIDKLIRETKDESWKIILALARYGGLRPHECLIQKWDDVDLVAGKLTIRSEKTPPIRVCPIFPELRKHLIRAREMADPGATDLQTRYRPGANACTQLKRMIIDAGLTPWPKLLQNLRATRETELLARFPAKDVTSWLGNSPKIAFKHYAMATDDVFAKAVAEPTPRRTPHKTPQSVQEAGSLGETNKAEGEEKKAIESANNGLRLNLSVLDSPQENRSGYPART